MSRTDNTAPRRLRAHYGLTEPTHKMWTADAEVTWRKRLYNRRDRRDAASDLRHRREPAPCQPRGRAIYDSW